MILRGSSGLLKISRDGFKDLDISEGYAGFVDCGVGSTTGAEPAADAGFSDVVRLGVGNAGGVKRVRIAFKLFEEINNKREIILIIFFISSFSKSLKINLFNNIINNFRIFIIIIIFFNNFLNSFKSKKINLLNIIFFFNYIFLY